MGFFDSFNKKEGVEETKQDNSKTDLPTPPKVQQPQQSSPQSSEPIFQPSPVGQQNTPVQSPKPSQPMQTKETNMPSWPEKKVTKEWGAPQQLPNLPEKRVHSRPEITNLKKEHLPKYNVEEIPSFNVEKEIDMPALEELPVLDVEERESLYKNYRHKHLKEPLYVRTDHYKEVLEILNNLKNYIDNSGDFVYSLENLKKNADIHHKDYKDALEDIQRKLIYVDKTLFSG